MDKYLSISKMAKIHSISRQTLIYYDKIGLFSPIKVDENGYRYYSPYQIPLLREICFLKSTGIKLKDIRTHIKNRNLTTAISLLKYHQEYIDKEIENLLKIKESIETRLLTYTNVSNYKDELSKPIVEEFPERKVIFFPYKNKICKKELHLTMMKAWNTLARHGMLPASQFGTIIRKDCICEENIFEGAGAFITLSSQAPELESQNIITLRAGQYVTMYKYGMPYDTRFLSNLLEWVAEHNYRIKGDIVDACFLDTTFYDENTEVDFCQLQIPVEQK